MAPNNDLEKLKATPRTSHTDENCVIVSGLIREDQRVKVHEIALQKTVVQHFSSLGKEQYPERLFKLVK
jgi:hypothetical protein